MKHFELMPNNSQKSFYKKAIVETNGNKAILKSYDTIVCGIDKNGFHRYWNGYSVTTMKHINSFIDLYNIPGGGKKWWLNTEIERFNFVDFFLR